MTYSFCLFRLGKQRASCVLRMLMGLVCFAAAESGAPPDGFGAVQDRPSLWVTLVGEVTFEEGHTGIAALGRDAWLLESQQAPLLWSSAVAILAAGRPRPKLAAP